MTETFCGKDCDLCQEKLSEACSGGKGAHCKTEGKNQGIE